VAHCCIVALIIFMALLPQIPVGWLGAVLVAIFGFFFVTVSSRLVGMVGSSSNPVSGMTIATILLTALIMKASGGPELRAWLLLWQLLP